MNKKIYAIGGIILGLIFIGLAIYYWITPAGLLPQYLPGFEVGSSHVHFKHGLASLLLGLALFAFAWFKSGKKHDIVKIAEAPGLDSKEK